MDRMSSHPRMLTEKEKQDLRRDMAESSAWAKAELERRQAVKNQKNAEHGTGDGIEKGSTSD